MQKLASKVSNAPNYDRFLKDNIHFARFKFTATFDYFRDDKKRVDFFMLDV